MTHLNSQFSVLFLFESILLFFLHAHVFFLLFYQNKKQTLSACQLDCGTHTRAAPLEGSNWKQLALTSLRRRARFFSDIF